MNDLWETCDGLFYFFYFSDGLFGDYFSLFISVTLYAWTILGADPSLLLPFALTLN